MSKADKRGSIKSDIHELERVEGRAGADTLRLWESYREQAYLWRALALLQIPGTLMAILAALIFYATADTIIEVPAMPQPGHYSVTQLPDSEFINFGTHLVNHIASYQPRTARKQFMKVRELLWEPALTAFEEEMVKEELKAIEQYSRSQLFFIDTNLTQVERSANHVTVRLVGTRRKMIGDMIQPEEYRVYYVKMTTIPKTVSSEFGIVAVDIRLAKYDPEKHVRSKGQDNIRVRQ